jgi:hypothetical protein
MRGRRGPAVPVQERFAVNLQRQRRRKGQTVGCLVFTGATDNRGYGRFWFRGKARRAHRVAFFLANECWPHGILRHVCDNPPCCEVSHLIDGTQLENVQDAIERSNHVSTTDRLRVTHCIRGHLLDEGNTYLSPQGHRKCRTCGRENAARYYRERKANP